MFINGVCFLMVYVSLPRFASGNGPKGMHAENGLFLLTTVHGRGVGGWGVGGWGVGGGGVGGGGWALWNSPIY